MQDEEVSDTDTEQQTSEHKTFFSMLIQDMLTVSTLIFQISIAFLFLKYFFTGCLTVHTIFFSLMEVFHLQIVD